MLYGATLRGVVLRVWLATRDRVGWKGGGEMCRYVWIIWGICGGHGRVTLSAVVCNGLGVRDNQFNGIAW